MPSPGRKRTDAKREHILAAASHEFAQREFHQVLMDDVALRAGVGKGTLYRYFPDKGELFVATMLRGMEEFHFTVVGELEQPFPLEEILLGAVRRMLDYLWKHREFLELMMRYEHRLPSSDAAAWQERRHELIATLARVLQQAQTSGGARTFHPRRAAHLLMGMVRTAVLYREDGDEVEDVAREIVAIFVTGIKNTGCRDRAPKDSKGIKE